MKKKMLPGYHTPLFWGLKLMAMIPVSVFRVFDYERE